MAAKKRDDERPTLQVSVIGEGGEVIVQVYGDHAVMTVRSAEREELASVQLSSDQAQAVSDALQRTPEKDPDDDY